MTRHLLLSAAAAALALACAAPSLAQAPTNGDAAFRATTLNLTAFGETRLVPDQATISLGVTTQGGSAAEAMRKNRERMTTTLAALKAQGLADRDVQTSNLDLQAQYAYEQGQAPRLTGYQASNQVTITVRDLARLGAVIDAVVQAGANQVAGISFGLADPSTAEDAARRAAVKALTAKAALYAEASGYRVGRLVTLSESGGYSAPPPRPMAMARMAVAEATPVQAGELRVRIEVSGTYELTGR